MTPRLKGIDHVHIDVADWNEAEDWYQTVLGFKRVDALMSWAVKDGPLTLEDPEGNIHLALFENASPQCTSAIAFGASGEDFLAWKTHLEGHALKARLADHELAFSLYFNDPYDNLHEITTYDHDYVTEHLTG